MSNGRVDCLWQVVLLADQYCQVDMKIQMSCQPATTLRMPCSHVETSWLPSIAIGIGWLQDQHHKSTRHNSLKVRSTCWMPNQPSTRQIVKTIQRLGSNDNSQINHPHVEPYTLKAYNNVNCRIDMLGSLCMSTYQHKSIHRLTSWETSNARADQLSWPIRPPGKDRLHMYTGHHGQLAVWD